MWRGRFRHTGEKRIFKVVLDTNALVSATIARGNEFRLLDKSKSGGIEVLLSPSIIKEFEDVLSRRRFGFSKNIVEGIVDEIVSSSMVVETKLGLSVIEEDPSDNRILECAVDGRADYIVSGDKHLLTLGGYFFTLICPHRRGMDKHLLTLGGYCGVEIVTAREMLKIIRETK